VANQPDRDPTTERMEREAFILLLHAFTVSNGHLDIELSDLSLGRDLAFERPYLLLLLDHLAAGGFVRCRPEGTVLLTEQGAEYIRERAKLRRSVRWVGSSGAPGIAKWSLEWRRHDPEDSAGA
jgi:hypothetical protein